MKTAPAREGKGGHAFRGAALLYNIAEVAATLLPDRQVGQ